jgi:ketosteroid isomerase-like protein
MIKYRFLLIFCLVFTMSGCAVNKMALTKGQSDIDLTKKSIALLSVRISNQYKPSRQLELLSVFICPQSESNCKHDLPSNPGSPYKPYKREKNSFNEYLLSYELESGTFNIDGFYTTYRIPTLISGFGFAKLNLITEIKPNSISYLGHLDIILREKKSKVEMMAGGAIPYIDQSIAGFSSGTFDVVVEDKFDEDMKSFISEYPALQKVKVEKSILPQWIRPEKVAVVAPKVEEPVTLKEAVVAPKVEEPVTLKEAVVVAPKVEEPVAPKEAVVVAPKIEEPVAPKEAVVTASGVTDKNLAQVNSKQFEKEAIPKEAIRNLVNKWLTSWKSGDMKTYRSCYTSDFQSKGMNLDAWVSHKTNVHQKSKKINISIDKLQISADENIATAVFTQHYSSAILKYSGKKKLELRKINDEWKIYREIM